jgi:hypothetical protein
MKVIMETIIRIPFAIRTFLGIILGYEKQLRDLRSEVEEYSTFVRRHTQVIKPSVHGPAYEVRNRTRDILDKYKYYNQKYKG